MWFLEQAYCSSPEVLIKDLQGDAHVASEKIVLFTPQYEALLLRRVRGYIPYIKDPTDTVVHNVQLHSKYKQRVLSVTPTNHLRSVLLRNPPNEDFSWPIGEEYPISRQKSVFTGYRCKIYNLAHRWPRKSTLDLHRGISLEGRYIPKRLPDSLIALLRLRVVPLEGTNQGPTRDPHKRGCELCARLQTMVCIHFV